MRSDLDARMQVFGHQSTSNVNSLISPFLIVTLKAGDFGMLYFGWSMDRPAGDLAGIRRPNGIATTRRWRDPVLQRTATKW
jgi:hypothetical protein